MKKALFLGIVSSFFFAFTFIMNRSISLSGGFWLWNGVLRYAFSLPILFLLLLRNRQYRPVLRDIRENPIPWLAWSTVGFGLFYTTLSAASGFAESWFTCAVWQFAIVAGVLLTPLFGKKIPVKNLVCSIVIVGGILLMEVPHFRSGNVSGMLQAFSLIAIASFAYPLGNRKMMALCADRLSTIQRVFGMTLCSMPFWLLCAVISGMKSGAPSAGQCIQSLLVALVSSVLATLIYFHATDLVRNDPRKLAAVEATMSGEVIFTLLLGVLVLHDALPGAFSFAGIFLIIVGMTANSLLSN